MSRIPYANYQGGFNFRDAIDLYKNAHTTYAQERANYVKGMNDLASNAYKHYSDTVEENKLNASYKQAQAIKSQLVDMDSRINELSAIATDVNTAPEERANVVAQIQHLIRNRDNLATSAFAHLPAKHHEAIAKAIGENTFDKGKFNENLALSEDKYYRSKAGQIVGNLIADGKVATSIADYREKLKKASTLPVGEERDKLEKEVQLGFNGLVQNIRHLAGDNPRMAEYLNVYLLQAMTGFTNLQGFPVLNPVYGKKSTEGSK